MVSGEIEPQSGFIDTPSFRMHYLDWGGGGDPVVILHATGFLGRIYAPIAAELTRIGHVYSCDQRGHGDSSPALAGQYDWRVTMEDLAEFIRRMGFGAVRAFGHSAGATAIGSLAAEQPELIQRAVLAEPVLFESPGGEEMNWRDPFLERTLKRRRIFATVDAMFENFDRKPPYDTWRKDTLRLYCEYGTRPTVDGKRELKCAPETEARIYETSREFDGLSRIVRAPAPMLVLFGDREDSLSSSLAGYIAERLPRGRVMKIPETGHFMPMEKPEEVARIAIDFLTES